jgi:alcohol dehydrogenase class IV
MDVANMNRKRTLIITDKTVANTVAFKAVVDSMSANKQEYDVYDNVSVEPTDISFNVCLFIGWDTQMVECFNIRPLCIRSL